MEQLGSDLMAKRVPRPPAEHGAAPPRADPARLELQRTFGHNFRTVRKERRMTQAEAAAAAGTVQSEISEIERGTVNLTAQTMEALARVVDCRVEVLLIPRTDREV